MKKIDGNLSLAGSYKLISFICERFLSPSNFKKIHVNFQRTGWLRKHRRSTYIHTCIRPYMHTYIHTYIHTFIATPKLGFSVTKPTLKLL